MGTHSISIQLDEQTYNIAEKLALMVKKPIPEMIKEMIILKGRATEIEISENVKKLTGILKTDKDYKTLRDEFIDDRIERYENIP